MGEVSEINRDDEVIQVKTETNDIINFLRERNIYVRKVADYGLKKSIRITVGTERECKLVSKQIQNFLELK